MRKIFYSFLFLFAFVIASGVQAQPLPPTLISPPDNAINVSLYPTFTWSTSSGATYYHLQVFTGATTVLDVNNITGTSYTVVSAVLTGNTYYYWRVAAANGSGQGNYSGYFHFTTTVVAPNPPVLTTPLNNAVDVSLTPTLGWNQSSGATEYRVQIATDNAFNTIVMNVPGLVNPGYVVPPGILANLTTYYWRVNAGNTGGTSNWSSPFSFTTVPALPVAPTLSFPANGATGVPVTTPLKWFKLPPTILSYQVQVSANASFTAIVVNENVTDSVFIIPGGALSGTTQYWWRVNATNSAGQGPWSNAWSFTTGVAPPAAPILLTPPDASTGIAVNGVTFDWNTVASATSYRIQISLSPSFTTTFVNQVTGGTSQYTHNNPPFTNNTTYYWRVNATNAGGTGNWSQVWSFTTIESAPIAPTLISPPNNSVDVSLTPVLDWNDVSTATSYRVQVSTSQTFTTTVVNTLVTTGSTYTVPSGVLQGYSVYYWRVAAINGGGQGSYSPIWNFRTVQSFNLNLKVYLEGFYNGTTQRGDTVKLYLAQNTSPYAFKDSSFAYIGTDGQANGIAFSKANTGNYYIVVTHRNHLETWSSTAMYFQTSNTVNYNFTDNANKAYGNNMKQVGSAWVLYGGDINQDGFVSPLDYDTFKPQFGLSGYVNSDLNGDGFVDGYDLPILNSNFGKNKMRPTTD